MKLKVSNHYPVKVWLTSLVVSPIILFLLLSISSGEIEDPGTLIGLFVIMVIIGILASAPFYFLYLLLFKLMVKTTCSVLLIKGLVTVFALSGMVLTLILLGISDYRHGDFEFYIAYSLGILMSGLCYRILSVRQK